MKVFVDTGAFCAFADRSDSFHGVAVRQFSTLLKEKVPRHFHLLDIEILPGITR